MIVQLLCSVIKQSFRGILFFQHNNSIYHQEPMLLRMIVYIPEVIVIVTNVTIF